jgi:hypothetical protein
VVQGEGGVVQGEGVKGGRGHYSPKQESAAAHYRLIGGVRLWEGGGRRGGDACTHGHCRSCC